MNNKYELSVQWIMPKEDRVDVTVSVVYSNFPDLPLFSLPVSVERDEKKTMSDYVFEAMEKATSVISAVADELKDVA